mgnify:CR=1 FL=1
MQSDLKFIQNLVDQIEANLADDINIVTLAKSCHLSPWHFQRLFKSLVGDTLGAYIRGRRLTKAAQLLLNSEQGLIDIAFSVGFNSHEAFTRSFKAYFKLSPKEFRKHRPVILLNEKPLLTQDLFHHIANVVQREPVITLRKEQVIVGFSTTTPSPFIPGEGYCDLLYTSWMNLFEQHTTIADTIPETFFGLSISSSGNFTEDTVDYIAGVPVTSLNKVPDGMVAHTFPEQWVALFKIATVDKDTVAKTMDYIYGYWLPNSAYLRGHGNDYELFEEVKGIHSFEDANLQSYYVIPVVLK